MKAYWERFSSWIDSRSLRERALIFAAAIAVLLIAAHGLLFEPLRAEEGMLIKQIRSGAAAIETIQAEISKMADAAPVDPNAQDRLRLDRLQEELKQSDAAVAQLHKGLVRPDQVGELLESVLLRQGKLQLVSLKKLPPQSLAAASAAPVGAPAAANAANAAGTADAAATPAQTNAVYKHGVEIVVRGGYFDVIDYLAALEQLPQQVLWGDMRYQVDRHPQGTLTLQLFTLSTEKTWLNL